MHLCPHCGASLPPIRDAFCPECGQELDDLPSKQVEPGSNVGDEADESPAVEGHSSVQTPAEGGRPVAIAVICLLGFLGACVAIPVFVLTMPIATADEVPYAVCGSLLGFFSFIGLWKMRRWGVCLYAVLTTINFTFIVNSGQVKSPLMIAAPLIVLTVAFYYFRRMR